jgi:hypothetical protein
MGETSDELVVRTDGESYKRVEVRSLLNDLSREDLTVLSAVESINRAPDEYPDGATADGERPATTAAVKHATDLTKRQVQYRLAPGERGLETVGVDGEGLLTLHEPQVRFNGGMGPRSAEVTPLGKAVLNVAGDTDDPTAVTVSSTAEMVDLEARVRRLEQVIEDHPELELPPLDGLGGREDG